MRRLVCALMMTLVLLTGCSRGELTTARAAEELALSIRTEYLAMAACAASVDITADYGQRVYEYSMDILWSREGETKLTVTAPKSIAGITARIRDGSSSLEFDGASLETGALSGTGLSPIEVVPAVLQYIGSGYIAAADFEMKGEQKLLWFTCRDPNCQPGVGIEASFWFDPASHTLKQAEIMSEGYSVVRCVFRNFLME